MVRVAGLEPATSWLGTRRAACYTSPARLSQSMATVAGVEPAGTLFWRQHQRRPPHGLERSGVADGIRTRKWPVHSRPLSLSSLSHTSTFTVTGASPRTRTET